ncbi:hypothetical protein D3C87_1870890 [compost metagenome]
MHKLWECGINQCHYIIQPLSSLLSERYFEQLLFKGCDIIIALNIPDYELLPAIDIDCM